MRVSQVFTYSAANALDATLLHGWGPASGTLFFRRGAEKKGGPSLTRFSMGTNM